MASPRDSIDDRQSISTAPDDSSMAATLDDLVAQPSSAVDPETLSNAIDIALELFAEAPAHISITAAVYKNLGVLFERRYQQQGDFGDLQTAITWAELGAATDPPGDPHRIKCLSNLASYLMDRYDTTGCLEDRDHAQNRIDQAMYESDHNPKPIDIFTRHHIVQTLERVDPISTKIAELAQQARDEPSMLSESLSLAETLLAEALPGDTININAMDQLGNMLLELYWRSGKLEDLQKSIIWSERACATIPLDDPARAGRLNNLAVRLDRRFERTGLLDDLEAAIMQCEQAVAATPLDDPNHATILNNLSTWQVKKFERTGAMDDLKSAILRRTEAVDETPSDHPDRATRLSILSTWLGTLFHLTGALDDLESAILRITQAVGATALDHPERAGRLNTLGSLLHSRFLRTGAQEDLDSAILQSEQAVAATPLDHPDRGRHLTDVGNVLHCRFERAGELDDLESAIVMITQAVAVTPLDRPDRAAMLSNLSGCLSARFNRTGALDDLQSAILQSELAVAATPLDDFQRGTVLNNLGNVLRSRFKRTGVLTDLESAIVRFTQAVAVIHLDHPGRAGILSNLSACLSTRFDRTGELDDLESAILRGEQALAALPLDHPDRARCLSNLSKVLGNRFQRTGALDDLESAILHGEQALATTPLDRPDRAAMLHILSGLLGTRFKRTGALDDLELGILRGRQAVEATPLDHPERAGRLDNLGHMLHNRFHRTGELDDIQSAIEQSEQAVAATPLDHPNRAALLHNLSSCLSTRFERTGSLDDLGSAILQCEQAVAATPLDHPRRRDMLNSLCGQLCKRFRRTGALDDLESAILWGEQAVEETPLDHPDRASYLNALSDSLGRRFDRTGALEDLESAILRGEQAVAAIPLDHPGRAGILSNLSACLSARFSRKGALEDLESAILQCEQAVAATSLDHPDRATYLSNLSGWLGKRFDRVGALADLESAIVQCEQAVGATPLNHPDLPAMLGNLSLWLGKRYERTRAQDDLESAILRGEQAVAITPSDRPDRAALSHNLSNFLRMKFYQTRVLADLESAIVQCKQAVEATPSDHPDLAARSSNLGNLLSERFSQTGVLDDLESAILRGEQAVAATPLDHPNRAHFLCSLGLKLSHRYHNRDTNNPLDFEHAVHCFKESIELPSAPPADRIAAAIHAVPLLATGNKWVELSKLTEVAITLLPRVSLRSLDQNDLQHIMKDYSGLACTAAAVALQAGKHPADAARLLELGRGVIANLQFETRTELSDLRAQHPKEAEEFERLRDELDSPSSLASAPSRRDAASRELDATIQKIRQLPNFAQFLLPPSAKELMHAVPPQQTCVVINVSSIRCDAFIIQAHDIRALALPNLIQKDIRQKARHWSSRSSELLKWLWDAVAGPVLDELGFQKTSGELLPRICWIPTGPLCVLPIHAAGYHSGDFTRTVLDRVVSSYSPSVKALLYARRNKARTKQLTSLETQPTSLSHVYPEPECAQPLEDFSNIEAPAQALSIEAPSCTDGIPRVSSPEPSSTVFLTEHAVSTKDKFFLACMEKTPGLPHGNLPFVKTEIEELGKLFARYSVSPVVLETPERAGVLEELHNCKVFHFAGHGKSDPTDPSKSCLLVSDWKQTPLTVKDVIALKLHRNPPFLAYLSACSTAKNQVEDLLDEGIHLMAACQLAGFQHVIGSLWEVSDRHCVDVAKDVYDTILQTDLSDESVSRGLHRAVLNLRNGPGVVVATREERDAVPVGSSGQKSPISDPRNWAAYIHIGM